MTRVDLDHPDRDQLVGAAAHLVDLPVVVVDAGWRALGPEVLVDVDAADLAGAAVLLRTGWDRHWGTPAYAGPTHPYLTVAGARHLVEAGVVLVGIDSVSVDDTAPAADGTRPTRAVLDAAGVVVLEHLTDLDLLPDEGARLTVDDRVHADFA